jgi:rRNA maturation RNase YbeY
MLGDVVISIPQAARQAAQAGHPLDRELAVLVIHGTLHLLGYDHERNALEARRMQRKERAILRKIIGEERPLPLPLPARGRGKGGSEAES